MYQFSRSLYRELAQDVVSGRGEDIAAARMQFLRACESSMERLALDRHYFAKPVRTLFNDVRHYFPMTEQMRVYRMCEKHMELATEYVDSQLARRRDLRRQPGVLPRQHPQRAPRASACRCRAASTARRTSTSTTSSRSPL